MAAAIEDQVAVLEKKCAEQAQTLTALHTLFCDIEMSAGCNAEQFHRMLLELEVRHQFPTVPNNLREPGISCIPCTCRIKRASPS